MFEINEYVNSRKGIKKVCHKDLKTKLPAFSLRFTKILTMFSLKLTMTYGIFPILLPNDMELTAYLVKTGLKIILSSEIGRITKQILDQINSNLCEILKVNELKNTASVINWL